MQINRKQIILATITAMVVLAGGELIARYYFGLGTPPLSVAHPSIEYMFKPDQNVYRFGNHIIINHYGMRSPPFAEHSADEFRIMVFGDSVLNGGSQTDHASLATTILQERLAEKTGQKVVVGNISAGSWGPGNWLAYVKEYGFFDANVVALIISSHDYADNPQFSPLDWRTHPTSRPACALSDGITRYLPRFLLRFTMNSKSKATAIFTEKVAEDKVEIGLQDLKEFLVLAKKNSTFVLVLQHWETSEIERGEAGPGNERIREVCEAIGIYSVTLKKYFEQSIQNGNNPYRDNIHPNQIGQQLIAKALLENMPNMCADERVDAVR